ncbi:TatD family hydrolase [Corynebacterium hindlerae]|uniref:TatD family hydrolase n=1 Tax=Corynebacterium hindlerae TaxID=699041 RepID=UPI003AAF0302
MLLDTHYHLDFLSDPDAFLAALDVQVVAQTVLPSSFTPGPLRSLGYHPWWVASDMDKQLELFDDAVHLTRFIGEIGLDFSPRRLDNADLQQQAFRHIVSALDEGHVMSIHAVRSASAVLDVVEGCPATPIIHWFSGNSDELTRLIRMGGCISVNPRMLETKRGRAFVKQVPADRILLETDFPSSREQDETEHAREVSQALHETAAAISSLRGTDIVPAILENQQRLFGVS